LSKKNIKIDPKIILSDAKACVYLVADKNEWLAVEYTIMNLIVPLNTASLLTT
jgi:hypothetical protein